ncbi:hypothetical protein [Roseomonas sp. USHLN139]|uniref:hypothetical protein n=1 Tax=Roseomonas sp. USHLN139 TaxID=3081298 RepID=UPI003B01D237
MPDDSTDLPTKSEETQRGAVIGARVAFAEIERDSTGLSEPCHAITFRHPPLADKTIAFAANGRDQLVEALSSASVDRLVRRVAGADMAAFEARMAVFGQSSNSITSAPDAGNIND